MNKIQKAKSYYSQYGMKGTINLFFHSLLCKLEFINTFLYFLRHSNLSIDINIDINDWKDYLELKKRYASYLKGNAKYKLKSTERSKIIWWCWLQGEENAPQLCKVCLNSLRNNFPDYEIKIITDENKFSFVELPDYIIEKYKNGIISRTHFSDILRVSLLVKYGGVWIDSTVLCTGYNEDIFKYPLFVYQDWKFNRKQASVSSSWLISAWKEEPILSTTRDLLYEYWKENNKLINYYLYHLFFHLATEYYEEDWRKVPRFSNIPPHLLQFELFNKFTEERFRQIIHGSDFHKLTFKDPRMKNGIKGSFYNKLILGE